jgi:signal transduction histidine kinase/ActR/RegA family two-component response regulator
VGDRVFRSVVRANHLEPAVNAAADGDLGWRSLPHAARAYVVGVIAAGMVVLLAAAPRAMPSPILFLFLLLTVALTSAWKVNLPISLASGSTLSVSYAANLMALLLLGPRLAIAIAAVGAWVQCTINVRRPYPLYRTAFSVAAEILTMASTGAVFRALGGTTGAFDIAALLKPLVGAMGTYFAINTGLVAMAVALSSGRSVWRVWRDDFLWSVTSFVVAGTAGAVAAVVLDRGEHWKALVMLAPVYLAFQTYRLFVARLEDQKRHLDEMTALEAERRKLLEREQAARASAESANRLKDQFLATVSHELRTPMNAILGWADMLRLGTLPDDRRERAHDAIYNNATRQARLIDELLDMARIMAGKLQLQRTEVDPRDLATAALEIVQITADAKRISIDVQVDDNVGPFIGDGPRLQQVVWNLLANAVKFTPEGGAVRLRLSRQGEWSEIVVSDSGIGIPREFLPSIFEPFRQADGSPTREHEGLGLGLAIVKQVVQAHGGTIAVDSPGEGHGATFTVRLPAVAAPRHEASVDTRRRPVPRSLKGVRVLVVDDDFDSREVVTAHLESHHATVITAASAPEALDVLQRQPIDVLIADLAMPGEDGFSLLRRLRALSSQASMVPAAALTAYVREEDRQRAFDAGFQMHLAKPIDAASLLAAVASLHHSSALDCR